MAKKTDPKTTTVTLGGKEYAVPKLVLRQLIEVRQALIELNSRFVKRRRRIEDAVAAGDKEELAKLRNYDVFSALVGTEYEELFLRPVYHSISPLESEMDYESFLKCHFEEGELVTAWFTVIRQSGLFVTKDDVSSGEAKAARTKSQTGS